jgi:hypothetical protein
MHNMTKPSVTEISSAVLTDDPRRLAAAIDQRQTLDLRDSGYVLVPREAILDLADEIAEEELLEEMVTYRKNVTGVANTIFISHRGSTRHAARIKLALEPPDSVDPRSETASISIADGTVVAGDVPDWLLDEARRFIALNRDVLLDYWDYKIDTDQLRQRLRSVDL